MQGKRAAGRLVGLALVIGCLFALGAVIYPYVVGRAEANYSEYVTEDEPGREWPVIDWEALWAVNPDVIGWVRVEGTPIDYPIVQERKEAPGFYLDHGLDGTYNIYGIPYVDADCDGLFGPLSLIYGHHMIDGTMFAAIANYPNQDYFNQHHEILLLTPEKNMALEAVCSRELSASYEQVLLNFGSSGELSGHLISESEASPAVGRVPTSTLNVYEFVSCSYGVYNGRTVLLAVDPNASSTKYQ